MTEYVTQNIRTVLKTFQNSAPKSLQGPGHSLQVASGSLDASHAGGDLASCGVSANAHSRSPCSSVGEHCHLAGAAVVAATAASTVPPPVALIKKEIFSSPEPYDLNESPSITIVLPPPPELPQPILSSADSGSGELYETRLEGKTIGCYSLGGEMRLCLPQFLNNVLADFTLDQINRIFDELGIFCSQCTPDQLMEFKAAKILPSDVKACGLITRTDAERLCAALLHRSDRNIYISDAEIPKGAISFKVYHRCFGKCEGICTPDMYSYTKPTCIMCLECKGYFSPQKFVGHVHRKQENRTCHWGFDSRNWHEYLHVALDVENREKYQKILDELKEVEFKEAMKAQRDMSYLKRKPEMFFDDAMLVGPPAILPSHQQLLSSCVGGGGGGKQREPLDIPSKKLKNLDEASAYQLSEYQRYQALFYAQCVQQQRIGQMSAFRPWAPPKSFLQMPYNAVAANLPYLSQEPPVLQNPERVVRNTDRERFERTYQPNVALAPRKSILTKEREKEHRERERDRERERERDRERERERERVRDREREQRERERAEREQRERELERLRDRERSLERDRERERGRERELQQQKLQQQQQQQQVTITELMHIKQERATTPAEVPPLSIPPADEEMLLERHSNGPLEDDTSLPLSSPLSLSRSQQQQQQLQQSHPHTHPHKSNTIDMFQQRRHNNLHCTNSASSTSSSSTSSALSTQSAALCSDQEHLMLSSTSPHQQNPLMPHLAATNSASHHLPRLQQHLPLPPHGHQQQASSVTPPQSSQSPEEFSGSNEISSSTSPLPPPPTRTPTASYNQPQHTPHHPQQEQSANSNLQRQPQQTTIATVNQHAKLLPSAQSNGNASAAAALAAHANGSGSGSDTLSRIRINKNLINQSNFMRSPTPPLNSSSRSSHNNNNTNSNSQQHHQLLQHQREQYEHYKQQQQRFYGHQQETHTPCHHHHHQHHQHHQPHLQQQQPLQLPSQSSAKSMSSNPMSTNFEAQSVAGLNLSSSSASVVVAKQQMQLQLQQNGGSHVGSEFELSTDTDDDSLNGEPDSSNMLAPWELAVDALKDTRPKDRERILQLLQKLLQENQQFRYDNLQLSEELRKRDKQVCELQEQLYRRKHQEQQQQQQQQQQLHQQVAVLTTTNREGDRNEGGCSVQHHLPLRKSNRRESTVSGEATSVVVNRQPQQLQLQQHQQQTLYSSGCTFNRKESAWRRKHKANDTDSEVDEDELKKAPANADADCRERKTAVKLEPNQNASDNDNDDDDHDVNAEEFDKKTETAVSDDGTARRKTLTGDQHIADDKEADAAAADVAMKRQKQQQRQPHRQHKEHDDNSCLSETEDSEEEEEADEAVKAPLTLSSTVPRHPPAATTPMSPDSAATAGRLFDSSNSSDDESMKEAQMSASNALAQMSSAERAEVDDGQEGDEDEDEDEDGARRGEEAGGADDDEDDKNDNNEGNDGDSDQEENCNREKFKEGRNDRADAGADRERDRQPATSCAKVQENNVMTTTTVAIETATAATTAAATATPATITTNHEIQIKQEII